MIISSHIKYESVNETDSPTDSGTPSEDTEYIIGTYLKRFVSHLGAENKTFRSRTLKSHKVCCGCFFFILMLTLSPLPNT